MSWSEAATDGSSAVCVKDGDSVPYTEQAQAWRDVREMWLSQVEQSRARVALVDLDAGSTATYEQLALRLGELHEWFASRGLAPGDSIVTIAPNSAELAVLILGSLTFGTRIALIEPNTSAVGMTELLELLGGARVIEFGQAGMSVSSGPPGRGVGVQGRPRRPASPKSDERALASQDAVVIFSSGTTGRPKGVVHTHANIVAELSAMAEAYESSADTRHYLVLPLSHVSGLYRGLLMPLMTGGQVCLRRAFSPERFWSDVEEQGVHFVQLVPAHVALLNRSPYGSRARTRTLRYVGCASGPLSPKEQLAFEARFDVPILQGYGMTECTCGITLNSRDAAVRRPGVVGVPLSVNEVRLVDSAGLEVEIGEVGELLVRGDNVATRFIGYDGPQVEGAWLKTGDLARREADGNLSIVGRRDMVINRGAHKVYGAEVQESLTALPGVRDAHVVGVPHPILGQDIIGVIAVEQGTTASSVLKAARERLGAIKAPSDVVIVDCIPKNHLGKVMVSEVLELYRRHEVALTSHLSRSDVTSRLTTIVAEVCQIDEALVSERTSRHELARWDSLAHVSVLAAASRTFGVALEESGAFHAESVADIARAVVAALLKAGHGLGN